MWQWILAGTLAAGAWEIDATTLDGASHTGRLVQWTADAVVLETGAAEDGPQQTAVPMRDLVSIVSTAAPAAGAARPSVWIELADGSKVGALGFEVAGGKANIPLPDGASATVPTDTIRAVRLKTPNATIDPQWREILATRDVAGDLLVIRKKINSIDYAEGLVGDVDADHAAFTFSGNEIEVPRERIEGIVYYRPDGAQLPASVCRVTTVDGTAWAARSIAWDAAAGTLKLTGCTGIQSTLPAGRIAKIDFSAGKIVYLSDLEPVAVEWTPLIGAGAAADDLARLYRPRRDRSFDGGKLELDVDGKTRQFDKGLALRSRSLVSFRLPDGFRRFQSTVGIDARKGNRGHVRLEIRGDGRVLAEHVVAGNEEPLAVDVPIDGVKRLTILVDFGDDLDIADHLDLCNARIIK